MATIWTASIASPHVLDPNDVADSVETRPEPPTPMEIDALQSEATLDVMVMPVEILLGISKWLAPLSTCALVAWATVTGIGVPDRLLCASVDASVERIAISVLAQPVQRDDRRLDKACNNARRRIIRAGAPLVVVAHLLPQTPLWPDSVIDVAIGGRIDVLKWAWGRIGVDLNTWYGDDRWTSNRHAAEAMLGAAQCDRRAVVCWLLERATSDHARALTTFGHEKIILYGLEHGYGDVINALHCLQRRVAHRQRCWCPSSVKRRILREGRVDMLALLKDADCDIVSDLGMPDLDKVVRKGHESAARWIAAHLKGPKIWPGAIGAAAARGHLSTVAFAHDSGLGTCTPPFIAHAACNGHLHIVKMGVRR